MTTRPDIYLGAYVVIFLFNELDKLEVKKMGVLEVGNIVERD